MWFAALALVLVVAASAVGAGDRPRARGGARRGDVDVWVPVEPGEHERLRFFDGRPHGLVPRVVSVNKPPYVCDPDAKSFRQEDDFVFHLRSAHELSWDDIADRLAVHDGQVHYLGR